VTQIICYLHFYKIAIETGQYAIISNQLSNNQFKIYDIDGEIVEFGILWENDTFKINEGTYYLEVYNPDVNGYSFEIKN